MGVRTPKSFFDYGSFGLDVGIVCERCNRTAVFDGIQLFMYANENGANTKTSVPLSFYKFRCRCGSRKVRCIAVAQSQRPDPLPRRRIRLQPLYVLAKEPT